MPAKSFKESEEYLSLPRIQKLWVDLSTAMAAVGPEESILVRQAIPPWESEDAKIIAAWKALTAPENLEDLLDWSRPDMNPRARTYTEEAIEECRRRQRLNVEPGSGGNR